MEWISKIIEAAKLPTKFIVTIFLVSSAMLFLSDETLLSFKLNTFTDKYGLYIGVTALASGALLLSELVTYVWENFNNKLSSSKLRKSSMKRISNLDQSEKSVLREFYLEGQNTIKLPVDNPVVAGLINAGILEYVGRHGRMSTSGMLFSMKISNFVKSNLTYELIELPNGEPTKEEIDFLKNNRPIFIQNIKREDSIFNR